MKLTLVGLPLGNIQDISLRAIETLKTAQILICEDTRVFGLLWLKLQNLRLVDGPFTGRKYVINEFNEKFKASQILAKIGGSDAVLVTDAGLPAISDPGYMIVKSVIEQGGEVDIVPGPTAAFSALAISGFSADRVLYLGFLPKKTAKRNKIWLQIKNFTDSPSPAKGEGDHESGGGLTVIIYESPLRVAKTLQELELKFGGSTSVVVARELTKEHHQIIRGSISEVLSQIGDKPLKGECVLLLRV